MRVSKRSRSSSPQGLTSHSLPSLPAAAVSCPLDDAPSKDEKKLLQVAPSSSCGTISLRDFVVTLNVGGSFISALCSTLLSSPSYFIQWINNNFEDFDKDDKGLPFIDRDPLIFNHILNFFRGYGMPDDTNIYPFLAEDAKFYGVELLMKALGCRSLDHQWYFLRGPGVGPDRKEFSTVNILGVCGTEPLSVQKENHYICFYLEKVGTVEVGVIAAENIKGHLMLTGQDQAIGYRSTGELLYKLGSDVQYDSSLLTSTDKVTVRVQFVQENDPIIFPPVVELPRDEEHTAENTISSDVELPRAVFFPALPASSAREPANVDLNSAVTPSEDFFSPTTAEDRDSSTTSSHASNATAEDVRSHCLNTSSSQRTLFSSTSVTRSMSLPMLAPQRYKANITFETGARKCAVEWPAPVPPLCFAASMNGYSSVVITSSSPPAPPF